MKSVSYSGYGTKETKNELFGELLHDEDTADSYEVDESQLYFDGKKYYWLQASGCSCWDGDYDGWELTKLQLIKLGKARAKDEDGYRGAGHEKLMGIWITENIK